MLHDLFLCSVSFLIGGVMCMGRIHPRYPRWANLLLSWLAFTIGTWLGNYIPL